MVACHPCVVVGPSKRCTVPTSSGVVGPSQQCTVAFFAASKKSPAFSLWGPLPRVLLVAAIAHAGGDGEVQRPAGVHGRGGQEHGVHGEPSALSRQRAAPCTVEGPPTDAILTPVRFRRFQGNAATVCTVHAGTLPRHGALSADATVQRCTLRVAVRLRRSSGTRSAWWFPSLRRSSGPLTPWRRGRLRADAAARTAASCSARWRRAAACFQLRVRAEPREPRRHAVVVELSLDGDVRTTMAGADYSRGPLTVGLGADALSLTPDGASALETNVSMMTSAVGTRGEPVGSRATARPRRHASDARSVRWRSRSSMRWRAPSARSLRTDALRGGKGAEPQAVCASARAAGPARLQRSADAACRRAAVRATVSPTRAGRASNRRVKTAVWRAASPPAAGAGAR